MTLREISYALLELIRNTFIVDDERIDSRLIDVFVKNKREEFIKNKSRISGHNEQLRQTMWIDMELDTTNHQPAVLVSTNSTPNFIENRHGLLIDEIRGENHMAYPFTVVPFSRFRFSGNGVANTNTIYASVHGSKLYLTSKDAGFKVIEKVKLEGVFAEPLEVLDASGNPQLTTETGDYPIDGEIFNYIKKEILKGDFAFMLRLKSDETNDASGEIVQ